MYPDCYGADSEDASRLIRPFPFPPLRAPPRELRLSMSRIPRKQGRKRTKRAATAGTVHAAARRVHATARRVHATARRVHATACRTHATARRVHATACRTHATAVVLHGGRSLCYHLDQRVDGEVVRLAGRGKEREGHRLQAHPLRRGFEFTPEQQPERQALTGCLAE